MEEGLQNIILPNAAIVDLYNKHLVVIEGVEKVEKSCQTTCSQAK